MKNKIRIEEWAPCAHDHHHEHGKDKGGKCKGHRAGGDSDADEKDREA